MKDEILMNKPLKNKIKVIGFDADDTLWKNEDYYRAGEEKHAELLAEYGSKKHIMDQLFKMEMKNLPLFGYGVKSFVISMMETAIKVSDGKVSPSILSEIINMGKEILSKPVELLTGVKYVLEMLDRKYRLIMATKGDLLDQERKLERSSLSGYFHHIEVMSDKTVKSYEKLLQHLEIKPEEFLMIGNSPRSDILPPYSLGCYTIHVPYSLTWHYETDVEELKEGERFHRVEKIEEVLRYLI